MVIELAAEARGARTRAATTAIAKRVGSVLIEAT